MRNHVLKHRLLLLGSKNQMHITYCCSVQLTNSPNSANTAVGFSHIIRVHTLTLPNQTELTAHKNLCISCEEAIKR